MGHPEKFSPAWWCYTCLPACLLQTAESEGAPPADEPRALMKLKWTRYINQQERTTPHKKLKMPYIFIGSCPLLLQISADSIKTPFLALAEQHGSTASVSALNSTAPVSAPNSTAAVSAPNSVRDCNVYISMWCVMSV